MPGNYWNNISEQVEENGRERKYKEFHYQGSIHLFCSYFSCPPRTTHLSLTSWHRCDHIPPLIKSFSTTCRIKCKFLSPSFRSWYYPITPFRLHLPFLPPSPTQPPPVLHHMSSLNMNYLKFPDHDMCHLISMSITPFCLLFQWKNSSDLKARLPVLPLWKWTAFSLLPLHFICNFLEQCLT